MFVTLICNSQESQMTRDLDSANEGCLDSSCFFFFLNHITSFSTNWQLAMPDYIQYSFCYTQLDRSMLLCCLCQILTLNCECCYQLLLVSNFGEVCKLQLQFPILSPQVWYPVWFSAFVADLLQGVQRTLLHSLVVSVHLSSTQFGHSPLTSGIFTQRTATYWIFSLSDHCL